MKKRTTKVVGMIILVLLAIQITQSTSRAKTMMKPDWAIKNVELIENYYHSGSGNLYVNDLLVDFDIAKLGGPYFAAYGPYSRMNVIVRVTYHFSRNGGETSCTDSEVDEIRSIITVPTSGSKHMRFHFDYEKVRPAEGTSARCKDVDIKIIPPVSENTYNNHWKCDDGCCGGGIGTCWDYTR